MGVGLRMLESISISKRSSIVSGGSSVVVVVEVVEEKGLKLVVVEVSGGVFSMILKKRKFVVES